MAFARLDSGACVANLHASGGARRAEPEVRAAADRAVAWAAGSPLVLGGDLNVSPSASAVFDELERRHGLRAPTTPDAIDHILASGLEVEAPAAALPDDAREVAVEGLAVRLSDHAPVTARFRRRKPVANAAPPVIR